MGFTFETDSVALTKALKSIAPFTFTAKDCSEGLRSVYLRFFDRELVLAATDRYVAGRYTLGGHTEADEGKPLAGCATHMVLPIAVLKTLLAVIPKAGPVVLRINGDDTATLSQYGQLITVVRVDRQDLLEMFPTNIDNLIPDQSDPSDNGPTVFAVNPALMAKFAKVETGNKFCPMRIQTQQSALQPIRVSIGEEFVGIIMPMRLGDA